MIVLLSVLVLNLGQAEAPGVAQSASDAKSSRVRDALKGGEYPWYDSRTDRVQPVWPIRISWLDWLGERMRAFFRWIDKLLERLGSGPRWSAPLSGNLIGTILLSAAVVAFFIGIGLLWFRRDQGAGRGETTGAGLGIAARLGDLPEGIRPTDADPWAEANRRRAAGDLAGAVVCLFAYQLLALDQMGLIRLAPGRTGRHYVQSLRDRELIDAVSATLGLFEDVYYGRRLPSLQAFDSVWNRGLTFHERRRRQSAGGPR